ncbi:hypothetical protein TRM7557_03473 [Tritonibacter multivorans]|uniref:Uncharacterized protein n=2 Tax=Tritonibacter multivorans TaxID=928856 RepID=A0A0P1GX42_9RHOB|nr:hypothetical protein [Tritonibacter multivorans]MDA7420471.1 hypothetical protein [Tritonibacter multivorans]CUH81535.1 hypothetical protein TRM7557_03473 [Tritonibacter multivorans]SFC37611.1 hypothetical protein SAMN04488049_102310 [Tritonibacter multivorans]
MTTETKAQANFETLSRRDAADKISVKLGFCDRATNTLSVASAIVMRTLEEYGHDVDQFHARTGHRVELDCDSFRLDLRHRRSPTPLRQADGEACKSQLEILVNPHFPDHLDEEITELLLAMMLHNLICEMETATTVAWIDNAAEIDCAMFMSAFEAPGVAASDETNAPLLEDNTTPIAAYDAFVDTVAAEGREIEELVLDMAPVATDRVQQPKKRARFAPVDATFNDLAAHCEKLASTLTPPEAQIGEPTQGTSLRASFFGANRGNRLDQVATWATTLVVGLVSVPLALTTVAITLLRSRDLRYGAQMLVVLSLVALIQGTGIVQAALQ